MKAVFSIDWIAESIIIQVHRIIHYHLGGNLANADVKKLEDFVKKGFNLIQTRLDKQKSALELARETLKGDIGLLECKKTLKAIEEALK